MSLIETGGRDLNGIRLTREKVEEQLRHILGSEPFASAPQTAALLKFLVSETLGGRGDQLKQTVVGAEVFGRSPSDFDPRSDSIVRVQVRRLRQKLDQYYDQAGPAGQILIQLPKGTYVPEFRIRPAAPQTPKRFRVWIAVAAVLSLVAGGLLAWNATRSHTLAVLPFPDYGLASGKEPLGDAVAEDLIQSLGQISRLRVVARTSAFRFRDAKVDVREIGRQLGVSNVLEGNLHHSEGRLRISVRLVDAASGFERWSSVQEVSSAGIDAAGHTMVAGVAGALGLRSPAYASSRAPSPEAQDLVLRARHLAARGGVDNLRSAVKLFEQALALDPGYARAWGGLARVNSLTAFLDRASAPDLAPKIRSAAARALELDPNSADAHMALGRLAWFWDWDWNTAERSWKRAIEIAPNFAGLRQAYALGLAARRRYSEALEHSRRAVELDPLAFGASNDLGMILYCARRFEESANHARRSQSLAPNSPLPAFLLGVAESGRERWPEAIAVLESCRPALDSHPEFSGRLGFAYARAGRTAEARAILTRLETSASVGGYPRALIYTALGDRPHALDALELSAQQHETDFVFFPADPAFAPLQSEPRYAALCARLGLSP